MTAVGDPPRPVPDTRPGPGPRPAVSQFFRATTTPAKLRLLLVGLVVLCLVWGAVAAWVVSQRTAGADDVVSASGQATGLPLALLLLVAGVLLGYALYRAQRWLFQRTQRRLNPDLVVASVAAVVSLLWLAVAFFVARGDLLQARDHGSTPVAAL